MKRTAVPQRCPLCMTLVKKGDTVVQIENKNVNSISGGILELDWEPNKDPDLILHEKCFRECSPKLSELHQGSKRNIRYVFRVENIIGGSKVKQSIRPDDFKILLNSIGAKASLTEVKMFLRKYRTIYSQSDLLKRWFEKSSQ
jgi:hypothetical protein